MSLKRPSCLSQTVVLLLPIASVCVLAYGPLAGAQELKVLPGDLAGRNRKEEARIKARGWLCGFAGVQGIVKTAAIE